MNSKVIEQLLVSSVINLPNTLSVISIAFRRLNVVKLMTLDMDYICINCEGNNLLLYSMYIVICYVDLQVFSFLKLSSYFSETIFQKLRSTQNIN